MGGDPLHKNLKNGNRGSTPGRRRQALRPGRLASATLVSAWEGACVTGATAGLDPPTSAQRSTRATESLPHRRITYTSQAPLHCACRSAPRHSAPLALISPAGRPTATPLGGRRINIKIGYLCGVATD